jgi:hypothetical protein
MRFSNMIGKGKGAGRRRHTHNGRVCIYDFRRLYHIINENLALDNKRCSFGNCSALFDYRTTPINDMIDDTVGAITGLWFIRDKLPTESSPTFNPASLALPESRTVIQRQGANVNRGRVA